MADGEADVIHGDADYVEGGTGGRVEFVEYSDTRIALRVQSPSAAYLSLKDAYYPGWQATLNDEPTPIFRANVMFRAVAVPAGKSAVVFSFEPRLWQAALYGGGALWMMALAYLFILWRRR